LTQPAGFADLIPPFEFMIPIIATNITFSQLDMKEKAHPIESKKLNVKPLSLPVLGCYNPAQEFQLLVTVSAI
jgi:hypothetical protein